MPQYLVPRPHEIVTFVGQVVMLTCGRLSIGLHRLCSQALEGGLPTRRRLATCRQGPGGPQNPMKTSDREDRGR